MRFAIKKATLCNQLWVGDRSFFCLCVCVCVSPILMNNRVDVFCSTIWRRMRTRDHSPPRLGFVFSMASVTPGRTPSTPAVEYFPASVTPGRAPSTPAFWTLGPSTPQGSSDPPSKAEGMPDAALAVCAHCGEECPVSAMVKYPVVIIYIYIYIYI